VITMMIRRLGCLLAVVCLALVATPAAASPSPPTGPAARPVFSASDADAESSLVAADDSRLTDLRTVASLARWQNKSWKTPYRIATGDGYTLVLTPSSTPYTLLDLLVLEPQTLLRLNDGSVLLEENIVVNSGAVLQLSQPGGLTLHLASSPSGFVSIVSFGGRVSLSGSRGHNLVLDGWDEQAGQRDTRTSDGRAYIRMIGGQFSMNYVEATALGFWSGRTSGIALTGTSRPDTGAVQSTRPGAYPTSKGPTVTDHLGGTTITAAGALPSGASSPALKYTVPAQSYVSSSITNSSVHGDAYGLFVSGASGVTIADSKFDDNQIAGIQLHRFVSDGSIERTEAIHNGGDGIALERGTEGIRISEVNANYNALQMKLNKKPSATTFLGTTYFTLSYTYAHSIDNSSGFRNRNSQIPFFERNLFRASSDYDIRHQLSLSGGWDLPLEQAWTRGPKRLTKGWSLYPILQWHTGFPLDVFANLSARRSQPGPSGVGDANLVYATLLGPVVYFNPSTSTPGSAGNNYFSAGSFGPAATDALGNIIITGSYGSGRNILRGPSRTNLDMALAKATAINDRVALQLRAEFFNIFNHTEFLEPDTNLSSGTFGQVTSTYDPRVIQFGVRLKF